eukprot:CAMPEP_0119057872 /NCGR_PEP_ID=MMETSP1178-20130426/2260_1 /TAXON_ID=33656 /ORGANISM="unid sp, Strain CCMP2000" /LENGTH=212 /DNA_ID=CAMNT_0007038739 /DNA_START=111 /DNA_END=750 /DNA_ORIENTATION=+
MRTLRRDGTRMREDDDVEWFTRVYSHREPHKHPFFMDGLQVYILVMPNGDVRWDAGPEDVARAQAPKLQPQLAGVSSGLDRGHVRSPYARPPMLSYGTEAFEKGTSAGVAAEPTTWEQPIRAACAAPTRASALPRPSPWKRGATTRLPMYAAAGVAASLAECGRRVEIIASRTSSDIPACVARCRAWSIMPMRTILSSLRTLMAPGADDIRT